MTDRPLIEITVEVEYSVPGPERSKTLHLTKLFGRDADPVDEALDLIPEQSTPIRAGYWIGAGEDRPSDFEMHWL